MAATKRRGFFVKEKTSENKTGKFREDISGKDKRNLINLLGAFSKDVPMNDLHLKLKRSRRFSKSKLENEDAIVIISRSGYSGRMSRLALHGICNT